jgi:hypothetical protein
MWYNGFLMDDGYYFTFIIWKDNNCITWTTYNHLVDSPSTFDAATTDLIKTAIDNFSLRLTNPIYGGQVNYSAPILLIQMPPSREVIKPLHS